MAPKFDPETAQSPFLPRPPLHAFRRYSHESERHGRPEVKEGGWPVYGEPYKTWETGWEEQTLHNDSRYITVLLRGVSHEKFSSFF